MDRPDLLLSHVRPFVDRARVDCDHVLEFQCPKYWGDLTPTDSPTVRHCDACSHAVYLVMDDDELRARASRGECVAVILPQELPASPYVVAPEDGGRVQMMAVGRPRMPSDD